MWPEWGDKKCIHSFGGEIAWKVAVCMISRRWEEDI
jgi:hypothetical protein